MERCILKLIGLSRHGRAIVTGMALSLATVVPVDIVAQPVSLVSVRGVLLDKATDTPVPRALVTIRGTQHRTLSDLDGRFLIDSLEAGEYVLEVRTAFLDSLSRTVTARVTLRANSSQITIRVPRPEGAVRISEPVRSAADFDGFVSSGPQRRPVAGAEVVLPLLDLRTITDDSGRFRFTEIPGGVHIVQVRRLGMRQVLASVSASAGQRTWREFVLDPVPLLDTVSVTAAAGLRDFEEHRRLGLGKFITRAELAAQEGRRLGDILSQLGGIRILRSTTANRAWVASTRNIRGRCTETEGGPAEPARGGTKPRGICACFSQVYLDGAPLYRGGEGGLVPDVNAFLPSSVEAIEFYPGPASLPAPYSHLNASCGVLVIHTRRSLDSLSRS